MYSTFNENEKCNFFDKIADNYFVKNFGTMSKSDFETLIFSEYIEHCINNDLPFDDYTLSKELGITQSRIRSLKERKELKYPHIDFDWKSSFAQAVKSAKYDDTNHRIRIIIEDINVMNEIRHYIEQKGWYDECSLNKKLLTISLDCFVEICIGKDSLNSIFSPEAKINIKKIANSNNEIKTLAEDFTKEGFKKFLMSATKEGISTVLKLLPFGNVAQIAFSALGHIISNM